MHQALALPAQGRCRPLLDPLWGNPAPLPLYLPACRRPAVGEAATNLLLATCSAARRNHVRTEGYAQSVPHFFPVHPGWLGPCIALLS